MSKKVLHGLFAEIATICHDEQIVRSEIRRTTLRKKMRTIPKAILGNKTFVSLLHAALLPQVGVLKTVALDLRHAAAQHRLKHMPRIRSLYTIAPSLVQQVAAYCTQITAPMWEESKIFKKQMAAFVGKVQERQAKEQKSKAFVPHDVPVCNKGSTPFPSSLASLQHLHNKKGQHTINTLPLKQHLRNAFKEALKHENLPQATLEEKKQQILSAATLLWETNTKLDFKHLAPTLRYYLDFSHADIKELQYELWNNRPMSVRERQKVQETTPHSEQHMNSTEPQGGDGQKM